MQRFRPAAIPRMLVRVAQVIRDGVDSTLDQLLAAVQRGEIDPASLSLAGLCRQFAAEAPAGGHGADQIAALIGALSRLMELKSLALLPPPPVPPSNADGPDELEGELEEFLRQHREYRAAAEALRGREELSLRSFARLVPPPLPPPAARLSDVTLDRLAAIVREVLKRRPPEPAGVAPRVLVTVRERLAVLEERLAREGRVSFRAFITDSRTRLDVVVSFMAVLELIKRGALIAEQPEPFGDIVLARQALVDASAN